jgi:hypothetical protein
MVKSWVGLCQSGFIRLWVGHGETPWRDRDHHLWGDKIATLVLVYLRHSY